MALIKLNIESFKKDKGGILNKLVDQVVDNVENKLENAVEGLVGKALKKVGLSSSIANEIVSRFGDAFSKGKADEYFKEFNSEVKRMSPDDIKNNLLAAGDAETYTDAIARASNRIGVTGVASTMQYPSHIGKYFMTMKFAEYSRPSPEARANLNFKQAIVLPIPREIKESFNINVDEQSQGFVGGIADVAATSFGTGKKLGDVAADQAYALAYSKAVQTIGQMDQAAGQVLQQFAGAAPNPHVQAIFSGIPLRVHRFDWTFAPRNAQESAMLRDMVFALKAYSLPSYSRVGTAALQYPLLCQIDLYPWAEQKGEELVKFTPSILRNVEINYSPQGMPSFFAGTNLPTMISFSLEFIETEIHTGNTYGRQGDSNLDRQAEKIDKKLKEKTGYGAKDAIKTVTDLFE